MGRSFISYLRTDSDAAHLEIDNDDYDSEGDILFLEELLSNDSLSLPENESFHFNIPSSRRHLDSKPPMMIEIEPEIAPDYEASCARGFVLRSLELQSLA
ncbi:hypothetical protein Tco_0231980 [Tanacetum coccineum]